MKAIVMVAAVALGMGAAGVASASDDLAQKSGCNACHAKHTKKMGPSYKDISAKFKGKADAEKTLVGNLMSGKGHPQVKSSEADTTTLVKWILAM